MRGTDLLKRFYTVSKVDEGKYGTIGLAQAMQLALDLCQTRKEVERILSNLSEDELNIALILLRRNGSDPELIERYQK